MLSTNICLDIASTTIWYFITAIFIIYLLDFCTLRHAFTYVFLHDLWFYLYHRFGGHNLGIYKLMLHNEYVDSWVMLHNEHHSTDIRNVYTVEYIPFLVQYLPIECLGAVVISNICNIDVLKCLATSSILSFITHIVAHTMCHVVIRDRSMLKNCAILERIVERHRSHHTSGGKTSFGICSCLPDLIFRTLPRQ